MEKYPRVILGAGKQADNVLRLLDWMGLPWGDVVLFDDRYSQTRQGAQNLPIMGTLEDGIQFCCKEQFSAIVALGSLAAAARYAAFKRAVNAGVQIVSLIHPSCAIAPSAAIGRNVVLMPGCVVGPGAEVGSLCCFYSNVTVEHDCRIGENVMMGPGVTLASSVQIGAHCFLGAGVVSTPGVTIGERALVGAGGVVASDLPSGCVCYGVPARAMREVAPGDDVPTQDQLIEFCGPGQG